MKAVAVGWEMYSLTGSAFDLGLVGLVQFVPIIVLFLVTGQVADRYDRRTITWMAQSCSAFGVAALAMASAGGWLRPGLILAMAFFVGIGRAFEQPSLQSVLPNIVPAAALPRAIAGSTSAAQIAVVAGPALGGMLIAVSPTLVFAACALLWLSSGFFIRGIVLMGKRRHGSPSISSRCSAGSPSSDSSGGARRNPARPVRRAARQCHGAAADLRARYFSRRAAQLRPPARGPRGRCAGHGAGAGPLADHRGVGRTMFLSVAAFGAGTMLLALSPSIVMAMAAMAVVGASDTVSVVIRQTLVQLHTPDDMRGRVYAVNTMFTGTANQLGDFRAGAAAASFGTIPAVLYGGLSTLAVVLISTRVFRELYRADGYAPRTPAQRTP